MSAVRRLVHAIVSRWRRWRRRRGYQRWMAERQYPALTPEQKERVLEEVRRSLEVDRWARAGFLRGSVDEARDEVPGRLQPLYLDGPGNEQAYAPDARPGETVREYRERNGRESERRENDE